MKWKRRKTSKGSKQGKQEKPKNIFEEKIQELMPHIIELRNRFIRMAIVVGIAFGVLYYFSNTVYSLFVRPLIKAMPPTSRIIATHITSPFSAPFKLSLIVAFLIVMPYILYEFWKFISPGLYKKEKKFGFYIVTSSIILFYLGMSFAYFVILPLAFRFFSRLVPDNVTYMPDINEHLFFSLKLFFSFGLVFELPVLVVILVHTGLVSIESLVKKRRYIIFIIFVVAMFLTPPDVISQIIFAFPLLLLFELGVIVAKILEKKKKQELKASTVKASL